MTRKEAKKIIHRHVMLFSSMPDDVLKAIQTLEQETEILDTLDFAIDASNGDTNYFVGFRNGLRYAKSLIDGEEPQFENCTEQEPKTGHWIEHKYAEELEGRLISNYKCCLCRCWSRTKSDYCPDCGARMKSE